MLLHFVSVVWKPGGEVLIMLLLGRYGAMLGRRVVDLSGLLERFTRLSFNVRAGAAVLIHIWREKEVVEVLG